jgi:hypothetical protein
MPHDGYPHYFGEGIVEVAEVAIKRALKANRAICGEALASFIAAGFIGEGARPRVQQINDDQDIDFVYEIVRFMTDGWRIRYAPVSRCDDDGMAVTSWINAAAVYPEGVIWWRLQTLGGRQTLYGIGTNEEAREWASLLDTRADYDGKPYVPMDLESDAVPWAEIEAWGDLIRSAIYRARVALGREREVAARAA